MSRKIAHAAFLAVVGLSASRLMAQTWDGGGANDNWSTGLNWSGNVAPVNNGTAAVVFAGVIRPAPVTDVAWSVASVTFFNTAGANPWTLSGSTLTVGGGGIVNFNSGDTATIRNSIVIADACEIAALAGSIVLDNLGSSTLNINGQALSLRAASPSSITIEHPIVGTGVVAVNPLEAGTIVYATGGTSTTNTFTGLTEVGFGTLQLAKPTGGAGNDGGSAIQGPLTIVEATVQLLASEQIKDSLTVTISQTSTLNLGAFNETLTGLRMSCGAAITGTGTLAMELGTNGTITLLNASGETESVVATPYSAPSGTRVFDIGSVSNLRFTGGFTDNGTQFTVRGGGVLTIDSQGALEALNIGGNLIIEHGSLILDSNTVTNIYRGSTITIGQASGATAASLFTTNTTPFNQVTAPNVTIHPQGNLVFTQAGASTLRVGNLTLSNDADVRDVSGVDETLSLEGNVVVSSQATLGALISVPTISIGAINRTFDVNFGGTALATDTHLLVTGKPFSTGGSIIKIGLGRMVIENDQATGGNLPAFSVNAGTVQFGSTFAGTVLAPGAALTVAAGATAVVSTGLISTGNLSATLNSGATLSLLTGANDILTSLTINSGAVTFGGGTVSLSGSVTSAQVPGGPVPTIGATAPAAVVIPSLTTFTVTTTTNAASTTTGDLVLGGVTGSSSSTVRKLGPGQMVFTPNSSFLGTLQVHEGSVLLPSGAKFASTLVIGNNAGADLVTSTNGFIGSANVTLAASGTLNILGLAATVNTVTMTGGLLTGSQLTMNSLIVNPSGVTTTQIDSPISVVGGTISHTGSITEGLLLNSNLVGGTHVFTATSQGYVAFTGTSAATTSVNIELRGSARVQLSRPGNIPISGNITIFGGSNPTLFSLTDEQIADSANVSITSGFWEFLGTFTETISTLTLGPGGEVNGDTGSLLKAASMVVAAGTGINTGILAVSFDITGNTSILTGDFRSYLSGGNFRGQVGVAGASNMTLELGAFTMHSSVDFGSGTLELSNATLDSLGTFTADGTEFSIIGGSTRFNNRGILTGDYSFTSTGLNKSFYNYGTMYLPITGLEIPASPFLAECEGYAYLSGHLLRATSNNFLTTTTTFIVGPGTLDLNPAFTNTGTIIAPAGPTRFLNAFTNSGTFRLTDPAASLIAPVITNTGRLSGDGTISSAVINRGVLESAPLGVLTVSALVSNNAGGTVSAPALSVLSLRGGLAANAGLVSLTGGTLEISGAFTNSATGTVSGYGILTAPGFRNSGNTTFAGGTATINAPTTNDAGKTLRVQAATAVFNYDVVNNGTLRIINGDAVFVGTLNGLPTAPPSDYAALSGTGTTIVAAGGFVQTDGINQASLVLQGSLANPADVQVISRQPGGTISPAGRDLPQSINVLGALSITGDAAPLGSRTYFGSVDLFDNDLILRAGNLATLRDYARAYLAGDGGLGSSSVNTGGVNDHATLGIRPVSNDSGLAEFANFGTIAVSAGDLLIKYTYKGDTNLDGTLDATDFNTVLSGLTNNLTGWQNGDSNYDGLIDATDWSDFLSAYAHVQSGGLPFSPNSTPGASIPEPTTILLPLAAAACLTRRRR
jgi:hypothetical protein